MAEALGLPGIGAETARLMTHKVAMRRLLADAGVPQPRFAAVRTLDEARRAARTVGFPSVLKPADSGGQRGVFRLESADDLERHLHAALAESPTEEAIVEGFQDGLELNGLVIARGGEVELLTLSDRLRPPGIGFGVGWIHVYPSTLYADTLREAERVAVHAVHAHGPARRDRLPAGDRRATASAWLVEVAARIPGGQMADLARHAVGVDLVEVALRQALGEPVPDELARAALPAAARDPLPDRRARAAPDREGARLERARPRAARSRESSRPTSS